ncbi:LuxR family transcriptional regulator [Neorhizobium galegae]|uniref:helix-turn-helix transcriptional regulator n=1 Tax=Rhizobium/Agrobacterium group TaxID=227290 RepID=UPI001FD8F6F2|nr:LuxR family transcriptional regulator [Neorhizobium galegae]MBP2550452.1 LuxR family transcriptional regulator [Neorhizobium galegae]
MINEIKAPEELARELENLLSAYGFDFYGIWINHKANADLSDFMVAGHWPEGWRKAYTSKKYAMIDPVRRMLMVAQRPYRWRDAINNYKNDPYRKRMLRLLQDAAKYRLVDGYTFPVHGRTGLLGYVSFGGQPVDLSPAELSLFESTMRRLFWRFLELRGTAAELEKLAVLDTELTKRQMEVLSLLADGLTSNEIARELQISSHTVDWYINVIQEKFGAKNRQHVIAMAFRLGLVS